MVKWFSTEMVTYRCGRDAVYDRRNSQICVAEPRIWDEDRKYLVFRGRRTSFYAVVATREVPIHEFIANIFGMR